jgi:hypothetical protein
LATKRHKRRKKLAADCAAKLTTNEHEWTQIFLPQRTLRLRSGQAPRTQRFKNYKPLINADFAEKYGGYKYFSLTELMGKMSGEWHVVWVKKIRWIVKENENAGKYSTYADST